MTRRFIFLALGLATASAALGQTVRPASAETPGPRPIARTEGRKILATIPTVDAESESETDCSHLVHDVYEQAGFRLVQEKPHRSWGRDDLVSQVWELKL